MQDDFRRLVHSLPTIVADGATTCDDWVVLIVLSGLPGTGKSAIADALGRELGLPVLSVDPIEAAMLRSGIQRSFATGLAAYAVASTIAESILLRGQSVIVDAVNGVAEAKGWWPALADRTGARLAVVECICSDPAVHRQRLETRARGIDGFPEPSWAEVLDRAAGWVPWTLDRVVVDAVVPLDENVAEVRAWLDPLGHNKTPEGTSLS